jgi:DNA-directed RNA polymerase subunit RPC12/RpoP
MSAKTYKTITCAYCGQDKTYSPASLATKLKYCSRACMGLAKKGIVYVEKVQYACKTCGTLFISLPSQTKGFCSRDCANKNLIQDVEQRFWSKVDKTDDCWFWTKGVGTDGYAKFWIDGRTIHASNMAWRLTHETEIPKGLIIMHTCDDTLCVRPDHLKLGTHKENTQDMIQKGRAHWQV